MAANSMVGYMLGLGDRHLGNLLIDLNTAEIAHIDYNACFEKGLRFRIPERVPFRLTRILRAAMGMGGLEGHFTKCSEIVLNLLRQDKITLTHLMKVFIYDPLSEWTIRESEDTTAKQHTDLKLSLKYISTHFSKTSGERHVYHTEYRKIFTTLCKCYHNLDILKWKKKHEKLPTPPLSGATTPLTQLSKTDSQTSNNSFGAN
eukprot:UN06683